MSTRLILLGQASIGLSLRGINMGGQVLEIKASEELDIPDLACREEYRSRKIPSWKTSHFAEGVRRKR